MSGDDLFVQGSAEVNGQVYINSSITVISDVNLLNLTGSGNAYACIDANGKLYRSNTTCV